MIIEIDKDVKPDWKFELLKNGQNNNKEEEMLIRGNISNVNINIFKGLEYNINEQILNEKIAQKKKSNKWRNNKLKLFITILTYKRNSK
jgi:hypothetical protein